MKISTRFVAICSFLVLALVVSACTPTPTPASPTTAPTAAATTEATVEATEAATEAPTVEATVEATEAPTEAASATPTEEPTAVAQVTEEATEAPTEAATEAATAVPTAEGTTASAATGIRIGVVTDAGGIDDRNFNQSAWEGAVQAADELGGTAESIVSEGPQDYAVNIQSFADQGYDVIVTIGFALAADTLKAAEQYPNIHFIGVDQFQVTEMSNVTGLIFPEEQSGFLAGVLAARMSKAGTIAAVLGTDQVPPVVRFKEGYEAGAKHANPDIKILSTYHPAGVDKAFDDPVWGAQTAGQAIDQGADVIFGAGGKTGNGALQEVAKRTTEDKPLYCIGVDSDQWLTVPEAHPCLITSAMKLITPGVVTLIKQAADGTVKGGNFVGEVGLAQFYDFEDVIPDEVKEELEQIKIDLASGKLSATGAVGGDTAATAEAEATEVATEAATEAAATMEATP